MATMDELLSALKGVLSGKQVFGDPYEKDGVTIIPAASVRAGGGGGSGGQEGEEQGGGGGFAMTAQPAGVYIVSDGKVRWMPAVDVNRALTTVATLLGLLLVTRARARRRELKARSKAG